MARRRILVLASAAIAALIVAAALVLDLSGRDAPTATAPVSAPPAGTGPRSATPTPSPTPSAAVAPSDGPASAVPGDAMPTDAPPTIAAPDPAVPLEVTGPAPESTGLPPSAPQSVLVTLPLPPAASASGALVAGFPIAVLPMMDDARIESSSVAGDGSVLRAGLVVDVPRDAAAIVAHYRATLSPLGFVLVEMPGNAGGAAFAFTRGADSVSLSIDRADAEGTGYSVFAVLQAG